VLVKGDQQRIWAYHDGDEEAGNWHYRVPTLHISRAEVPVSHRLRPGG
jgi:hypothetical protein